MGNLRNWVCFVMMASFQVHPVGSPFAKASAGQVPFGLIQPNSGRTPIIYNVAAGGKFAKKKYYFNAKDANDAGDAEGISF